MSGILVSAAWRSSGKTAIATGLIAGLSARGLAVQPFKKGPDYIDPQWLGTAAGRACRNLDMHLQGTDEIVAYWARHAAACDLALVEGNLGLHDGLLLDGTDSNAALAKLLGLPVVLVLDARGMSRGAAALLHGLVTFDPAVSIAGVILNRVGGSRHEGKLRASVEHYTGIPVLGAIGDDPRLGVLERHLGLVPAAEIADAQARVAAMREVVGENVDLDSILAIARAAAPVVSVAPPARPVAGLAGAGLRIGIARDRAFAFYYPDDIDAFAESGATLVPVDTINDPVLPDVDGLFIGGGFPETNGAALSANSGFRESLRRAIGGGLPVYAECGGLMYLARSLSWRGHTWEMVGALPADVVMQGKPVGKGYVKLAETGDHPWGRGEGTEVRAHEFHYSRLANVDPGLRFAYRVERGEGSGEGRDGIVHRNVLASYTHLRSVGGNDWVARFLAHVRRARSAREILAATLSAAMQ